MHMLNKIDKFILISSIILIVAFILPIVLIYFFINIRVSDIFGGLLFIFAAINDIFILPILFITKIIILIIKIFSKNKNIKDWIIILLDFFVTLLFGFIFLMTYGTALVL